jgi:GTPase SAR1 family protein
VIRIAVIGSASVGKSALINAVFGTALPVDARSGSTREPQRSVIGDLELIDAPPDTLPNADAYVLVCDKDLTATEFRHLRGLRHRPIAVVLNKSDTYKASDLHALVRQIHWKTRDLVPPDHVVSCAADPVRIVHREHTDGTLSEHQVPAAPDVSSVASLVRTLADEAGATVRVRSRELGRKVVKALTEKLREDP